MLSYVMDAAFLLVLGSTAWLLARRSLLEAASICIAVILSALIALNGFEPSAAFISNNMFAANDLWFTSFLWFASIVVIFAWLAAMIALGFLKVIGSADPSFGRFDGPGRWTFGLLGGYMVAAFLLTSIHTLPTTRDFWGVFPPELHKRSSPVMASGPDYQLLTLTEYVCSPRELVTGAPWQPRGPLVELDIDGNRWASFPVRYAIWREAMHRLRLETAELQQELNEYDEGVDSGLASSGANVYLTSTEEKSTT